MIISASRRTDIPAYYSEWLINRLREEYLYVRNPMFESKLSKISLAPSVVDCIVFWTKNAFPLEKYLDEISENYNFYFQYTITPYGKDIEPNLPDKINFIVPQFKRLAQKIGKERMIWRYDPILLTEKYNLDYHKEAFSMFASKLKGYTSKCVISFVDLYKHTENNTKSLSLLPLGIPEMEKLVSNFADTAIRNNIKIETCCEEIDFSKYGISHAHCIDRELIEHIIGAKLDLEKDKNQRIACGCAASIDIGAYNTCKNGCRYCYANYNNAQVAQSVNHYDPKSPILCGQITKTDTITERKCESCRLLQTTLF